jgi:hypothetical protein
MSLKPQNIIQAAEADLARKRRNAERAKNHDHEYEQYAFHRAHVRRARDARELIRLALMDPWVADDSAKVNTVLIYSDARLLVAALLCADRREEAAPLAAHP